MIFTIFTPTYNRSNYLPRLYESLCMQTFKDFEWLIVDDGSTDDTEKIISTFRSSAFGSEDYFPIRYLKKENGGKHTAINIGVSKAAGTLFFIADSDDLLPPNSLEEVYNAYMKINNQESFCGVCGLDADFNGKLISGGLPQDMIDCNTIDIRFKYHIKGDMKEVFYTSILKEFPFPEIKGERFVPEALLWNRIARKYSMRFINKVIYHVEYCDDGLTSKITKIRMESPIASMMCYAEQTRLPIPFFYKIKASINYWRFRFCSKGREKPHIGIEWLWTLPFGYVMHLNDLRK